MTTSSTQLNGSPVNEPQPAPPGENRFSQQAIAELEEIASHYPERKAACLPALWIAQREYGGSITGAAIGEVAERLGLTFTEVEGVATFYTMYNLRPIGRHHLEVCTCLTCAVMGAYDVVHELEHKLGISVGATTSDGEFTLSEVECLDLCSGATVVQVGDRYFTDITADRAAELIEQLRISADYTPARLADAIVKLHTPYSSEARL